jgi:hypothetical protein
MTMIPVDHAQGKTKQPISVELIEQAPVWAYPLPVQVITVDGLDRRMQWSVISTLGEGVRQTPPMISLIAVESPSQWPFPRCSGIIPPYADMDHSEGKNAPYICPQFSFQVPSIPQRLSLRSPCSLPDCVAGSPLVSTRQRPHQTGIRIRTLGTQKLGPRLSYFRCT